MEYLESLERKIGNSEAMDDAILSQLECEVQRCNFILYESSDYYEKTHDADKLEEAYKYEKEYKERCLEIIDLIINP